MKPERIVSQFAEPDPELLAEVEEEVDRLLQKRWDPEAVCGAILAVLADRAGKPTLRKVLAALRAKAD